MKFKLVTILIIGCVVMISLTITNRILLNAEAQDNTSQCEGGQSIPQFFKNCPQVAMAWTQFYSDIAFAATFGVLVYATFLQGNAILLQKEQTKSQVKQTQIQMDEMMVNKYAELRQHHHDLITALFEYPEATAVYAHEPLPHDFPDDFEKIILTKQEDRRLYNTYNAWFDLYERVWTQYHDKKIISEFEWLAWMIYLEQMSYHWIFRYAYNKNRPIFDNNFMDYIKEHIIDVQDRNESSREHLISLAKKAYHDEENEDLKLSYARLKIEELQNQHEN